MKFYKINFPLEKRGARRLLADKMEVRHVFPTRENQQRTSFKKLLLTKKRVKERSRGERALLLQVEVASVSEW